jgi:hypothetical protein
MWFLMRTASHSLPRTVSLISIFFVSLVPQFPPLGPPHHCRYLYSGTSSASTGDPLAPLPASVVPPGFLPRAATTTAPPAITDGSPPRTWPASPIAYVQREVGAGAAGTRGAPGAALRQEAGVGAQATRGAPGAPLSQEVSTGAAGTRGTPGAPLSQEVGVGVVETRRAPKLPYVGRREPEPRGHVAPPELS